MSEKKEELREKAMDLLLNSELSKMKDTEIANVIGGVSSAAIGKYKKGEPISENYCKKIIDGHDRYIKSLIIGENENTPNFCLVPIINVDGACDTGRGIQITDEPQYIIRHIAIDGAKEGDLCIIATGDSMTPTVPAGAYVSIRKVEDWYNYFGYGNIFFILLTNGRRIIKEVRKSQIDHNTHILCVSHNENVDDEELPRDMIAEVWKVMKILTDKGF